MKTQTSTPTLSSGRARAERCKELEEEKESNATEYGNERFPWSGDRTQKTNRRTDPREGDRRGSRAQGPGTKTEAGNRPGEQDRASPDLHRHHKNPVEVSEAPRNHSPEAGATQERAQAQR